MQRRKKLMTEYVFEERAQAMLCGLGLLFKCKLERENTVYTRKNDQPWCSPLSSTGMTCTAVSICLFQSQGCQDLHSYTRAPACRKCRA